MKSNPLRTGSLIKAILGAAEWILLIIAAVVTFSNDGSSPWGYWGSVFIVFATLSPILLYVIASTVFNVFNLRLVMKDRHTPSSIERYHRLSRILFIWGIVTGALYSALLVPIFLLENLFLFRAYRKEWENAKSE